MRDKNGTAARGMAMADLVEITPDRLQELAALTQKRFAEFDRENGGRSLLLDLGADG